MCTSNKTIKNSLASLKGQLGPPSKTLYIQD
jgi:hypothetical protein